MCGIAGVWGDRETGLVQDMLTLLAHRGPDAQGLHEDEHGTLGHRRLAIVDPGGGNQPLFDGPARARALVANGEIYNAPALRERLERRYRFSSRSDSESILHLYDSQGKSTAARLDGMFAFGLADASDLYLARDPLGIKPLYYGWSADNLVFASEMKALVGQVDSIVEFPPGTWYHTQTGFHSYYTVPNREPKEIPLDVVSSRLRASLESAVVKRLMSDVPVGAFLSGGLDSSIIAAIARQHLPRLHTFSVGVAGSPDLEAARLVANHLDTTHHEYELTRREIDEKLPEILYHLESYDRDLVRSAIPCYFVSRLAAEHVKVVLTGEGADELFAGYTYYRGIRDSATLHDELRRSVTALHNINLQRVDRLTMAHGLEARVPFLDVEMVDLAQSISPAHKLSPSGDGRFIEKWILRKTFEDLLPPSIVWRTKEQFDEGSGTTALLPTANALDEHLDAPARGPAGGRGPAPRTHEEERYRDLLCASFDDATPILPNVARWATEAHH